MYNILETRIEFRNNLLHKVTVLVDCTSEDSHPHSDVRAYEATTKVSSGYMSFLPHTELSQKLLQRVASDGRQNHNRDKIFPNWRTNLKNN